MRNEEQLLSLLRKAYALPPYNIPSNIVAFDGHFIKSIYDRYPKEDILAAMRELGIK